MGLDRRPMKAMMHWQEGSAGRLARAAKSSGPSDETMSATYKNGRRNDHG